ncbi:MAG TPA: translation initiation factor IF-3 [Candidatus Binataceae bacterium]|nr:translation initiation factor IF-3 [Candidatus Binataceae bacterium]
MGWAPCAPGKRRCFIPRNYRLPPVREPSVRVNELIRSPEVRVIDADGHQAGIMSAREALALAQSRGLDLVEVASAAQPPVCRVMDFDKYRYTQKKKSHTKKSSGGSSIKEVKMGARTDKHDLEFKVRHIRRFVEEGQRVKVSVFFRGREITHPEMGTKMLEAVMGQVQDIAQAEGTARMEGRNMSVLLTPR